MRNLFPKEKSFWDNWGQCTAKNQDNHRCRRKEQLKGLCLIHFKKDYSRTDEENDDSTKKNY